MHRVFFRRPPNTNQKNFNVSDLSRGEKNRGNICIRKWKYSVSLPNHSSFFVYNSVVNTIVILSIVLEIIVSQIRCIN